MNKIQLRLSRRPVKVCDVVKLAAAENSSSGEIQDLCSQARLFSVPVLYHATLGLFMSPGSHWITTEQTLGPTGCDQGIWITSGQTEVKLKIPVELGHTALHWVICIVCVGIIHALYSHQSS